MRFIVPFLHFFCGQVTLKESRLGFDLFFSTNSLL